MVLGHQELMQPTENMTSPTEIILYALVGSPSSQTIRVKGRIRNKEVVSLIASGSTHNLLDATELATLRLPLDASQILEVKAANDHIVKTLGVCHEVSISIQGYRFVDFNVLQLGACAIVLVT